MRTVFPDELHTDAPVTLAAVRELRAAATPFPDVPVVILSAARGFPAGSAQAGRACKQGSPPPPRGDAMSSSTAPAITSLETGPTSWPAQSSP
jgi:hypothetical protein